MNWGFVVSQDAGVGQGALAEALALQKAVVAFGQGFRIIMGAEAAFQDGQGKVLWGLGFEA